MSSTCDANALNLVLAAVGSGTNQVEREGLSVAHPAGRC